MTEQRIQLEMRPKTKGHGYNAERRTPSQLHTHSGSQFKHHTEQNYTEQDFQGKQPQPQPQQSPQQQSGGQRQGNGNHSYSPNQQPQNQHYNQ